MSPAPHCALLITAFIAGARGDWTQAFGGAGDAAAFDWFQKAADQGHAKPQTSP